MFLSETVEPKTRYQIIAQAVPCGKDWAVVVLGGTQPHIGAVSMAVYEPERDSATVSTITRYTHRDDQIAATAAKKLAACLKCAVTVSAGVHIDDAQDEELTRLVENCRLCCYRLGMAMENGRKACNKGEK